MARMSSPVFGSIRGSINGSTYGASKTHTIVSRGKVANTDHRSPQQMLMRSAFALASKSWQRIDDQKRLMWDVYAQSIALNASSDSHNPTGRNVMIAATSLARYIIALGCPDLNVSDAPPEVPGRYLLTAATTYPLTDPGTGFRLYVVNTHGTFIAFIVEISRPFDPSANSCFDHYDSSRSIVGTLSSPNNFPVFFTDLKLGRRYFWRIRAITGGGGIISHQLITSQYGSDLATFHP